MAAARDDGETLCYSAGLLRPFLELLGREARESAPSGSRRGGAEADARLPIARCHELLQEALALTGDELLGVRAAARVKLGDLGLLHYFVSSSATVGEALRLTFRYFRLLNDSLDAHTDVHGARVVVALRNRVEMPRAADDFQTCGIARAFMQSSPDALREELEVWFRYGSPRDLTPYVETLGTRRLRFSAPLAGFSFAAQWLTAPLPRADPELHRVLEGYAEHLIRQLPLIKSFSQTVRTLILQHLAAGDANVDFIAAKLRVSARTLARRLAADGSSFSSLLDESRRQVAMLHIAGQEASFSDIALLAGFSDAPAFFRAFRRWTGTTPKAYRRGLRAG